MNLKHTFITFITIMLVGTSTTAISADTALTQEQMQAYDSMSTKDLQDRKVQIENEIAKLEDDLNNTQSPQLLKKYQRIFKA